MNTINENAIVLTQELQWLVTVIETRIKLYFSQKVDITTISEIPAPNIAQSVGSYAAFIKQYSLTFNERVILLLALAPHIQPQILDTFLMKNASLDRRFTEFGGISITGDNGFYPTGQTAAFILAGNDLSIRFSLTEIFGKNHFFRKQNILKLDDKDNTDPLLSHAIILSDEYLNFLITGVRSQPDFGSCFPAKRITTELEWSDLVLDQATLEEIGEINAWIAHQKVLLNEWGLQKRIKPGYRTLLYGTAGTGKKLTAALVGKANGMDVYSVNTSLLLSKYMNETEKNINHLFEYAENKNLILFFDEADALFGKRASIADSNDRYAPRETAYLLERMEDYSGLIILASTMRSNIDEAFLRRFQSVIYFPLPDAPQRKRIWQESFPAATKLGEGIDLDKIAIEYELTPAEIVNAVFYCSLQSLQKNNSIIELEDIVKGIRKEFRKKSKVI